jgi:hypothetical protein
LDKHTVQEMLREAVAKTVGQALSFILELPREAFTRERGGRSSGTTPGI